MHRPSFLTLAASAALWVSATALAVCPTPNCQTSPPPSDSDPDVAVATSGPYTSGSAVATTPWGDYVVVWRHQTPSTSSNPRIRGQLFYANGTKNGSEFLISDNTEYSRGTPSVAMDAKGRFMVAWEQSLEVWGRKFNCDGTPAGSPTRLATAIQGAKSPSVAGYGDNRFMVVYEDWQYPTRHVAGVSYPGALYEAQTGNKAQFDSTPYGGDRPKISVNTATGTAVVVWSRGRSYGNSGIVARGWNPDWNGGPGNVFPGAQVGVSDPYETGTAGSPTLQESVPAVALNPNGQALAVWQRTFDSCEIYSVRGRVLSVGGGTIGGATEFPLGITNSCTARPGRTAPAVAADALGNFVAIWTEAGADEPNDWSGVRLLRYKPCFAGCPIGLEPDGQITWVNRTTPYGQNEAAIAAGPTKTMIATFTTSGPSILGRRWDQVPTAPSAPSFVYGDLDQSGTVDVFDVVIMASSIVGNVQSGVSPFTAPLAAADVNVDGKVDIFDVVLLQGFIVGNVACLPTTIPCTTSCASNPAPSPVLPSAVVYGHAPLILQYVPFEGTMDVTIGLDLRNVTANGQPAGLMGYDATLTFDTSVFQLTGVSGGTTGYSSSPVTTSLSAANSSGAAVLSASDSTLQGHTGWTILATLHFTAVDPQNYADGSSISVGFQSALSGPNTHGSQISVFYP